jgi:hypothetical protein
VAQCRRRQEDAQENLGIMHAIRERLRGPDRSAPISSGCSGLAEARRIRRPVAGHHAYSTRIAQGIDMSRGVEEQKKAVACGHWPLFRFNPLCKSQEESPILGSKEPTIRIGIRYSENRYWILRTQDPELAARLIEKTEADVKRRWSFLKHVANWSPEEQGT